MVKSIQTELQQTRPFGTLEEEAAVSLARAASLFDWRMAEMLKAHGISPTQYNALRILRGAGKQGRTCSEIGERMINRDPDITRLLDRLERHGLVERSRDKKDRRVITARITPAGLDLLHNLNRPVEALLKKLMGHMVKADVQELVRLLAIVREHAGG